MKKRIFDMSAFLQEQPTVITEYDEQLIRRLIEKVTVYEDKFTVEFKFGVTVVRLRTSIHICIGFADYSFYRLLNNLLQLLSLPFANLPLECG